MTSIWMAPRILAIVAVIAATGAASPQSPPPRVVHITAERFDFSHSRIVMEEGEQVELRVRSEDTSHGFRIVGTDVSVTVPKRGRDELSIMFRAPSAGRYIFECTRMCGAGHNFMRGVLIVRPRAKS